MEVPVKVIGKSPGVMAGGVLRLNQRKIKSKSFTKKSYQILLKLILLH